MSSRAVGTISGTPTTTKREVTTNAIVNNGESVILGGLIRGQDLRHEHQNSRCWATSRFGIALP